LQAENRSARAQQGNRQTFAKAARAALTPFRPLRAGERMAPDLMKVRKWSSAPLATISAGRILRPFTQVSPSGVKGPNPIFMRRAAKGSFESIVLKNSSLIAL
jgi:hypothetical protein